MLKKPKGKCQGNFVEPTYSVNGNLSAYYPGIAYVLVLDKNSSRCGLFTVCSIITARFCLCISQLGVPLPCYQPISSSPVHIKAGVAGASQFHCRPSIRTNTILCLQRPLSSTTIMIKIAILLLCVMVSIRAATINQKDQKLCGAELPATVHLLCRGQFDTNAVFTEAGIAKELSAKCCSSPCNTETLLSFCQHLAQEN
ncbi:hypothetical protein AVEN_230218-1 [Araneus ventricosus]|uniref:Insulin-like domain-containing protein n=1 Tax=Araneus ventricosus TaxID=182803 RepID=A0A4Y2DV32_ARAVE|nr:hypothetical protein AVEN_230218-1 [Araneus ventricosus]